MLNAEDGELEDLAEDFAEFWGEDYKEESDGEPLDHVEPAIHGGGVSSGPSSSSTDPVPTAAASSSGDPMPTSAASIPTGVADAEVVWPGIGRIAFYAHDQRFEATCVVHKDCHLTKTANAAKRTTGNESQGRCAGTLSAWLWQNQPPHAVGQGTHNSQAQKRNIPLKDREQGRDRVRVAPGGALLLSKERPQKPGEPEEPLRCP